MKKLAGLLALFFLLGGCTAPAPGGSASPSPGESAPSGPESPAPSPSESAPSAETPQTVRLSVLKGPIGMGAAKLVHDGGTANAYEVQILSANDEVAAGLTNGSIDIAGLATNLAANIYNKTNGSVRMIAVNTLGVLQVLENGDTVQSMSDLAGRTVYAMGQGANPEYVLRYLIEENGGVYEDVDVQWRTQEEVVALMATGEADLCMLPVPAATTVLMKNTDVRTALDLTEEWAAVSPDGQLAQSCFVARAEFIDEHPEAVAAFLADLGASVDFANENPAEAGQWAEELGIAAAAVAAAAIPQANLVCITGVDMRSVAQGYFEVLYRADPTSIGGANPDDNFYVIPRMHPLG